MSRANAQAQLQAVLVADTDLIAWAQTHFNREWTEIKSNKPVSRIRPEEMPCRVYELGDVNDTGPEVVNHSQYVPTHFALAVGWYEDDYDKAFDQRTALEDLLIKAVMANGTLNDSVDAAWVSKVIHDKNANHPKHFVNFEVSTDYKVTNP